MVVWHHAIMKEVERGLRLETGEERCSGETNYCEWRPHPVFPKIPPRRQLKIPLFSLNPPTKRIMLDTKVRNTCLGCHVHRCVCVCVRWCVCVLEGAYPDFVDIVGVADRLTEVAVPGCSRG